MSRKDIIMMAREVETVMTGHDFPHSEEFIEWCERFAALVAAAERKRSVFEIAESYRCGWDGGVKAEREACAKVCDGWLHADGDQCAAAIRARGEE